MSRKIHFFHTILFTQISLLMVNNVFAINEVDSEKSEISNNAQIIKENICLSENHSDTTLVNNLKKNSKKYQFLPIPQVVYSGYPLPVGQEIRLTANTVKGVGETSADIQGDAIIESSDMVINSSSIKMDNKEILMDQSFILASSDHSLKGQELIYNLETKEGKAKNFTFSSDYQESIFQGEGEEIELFQDKYYRLKNAAVNTCKPLDNSWYIESGQIDVDLNKNIGVARDMKLVFKGVPIFYAPWFDFPLNNKRKSGFLTPSLRFSSDNGYEFSIPYYFNLAPNYDLTIAPHLYTKRGLAFDYEFRYLKEKYSGLLSGSILPHDRVVGQGEDQHRYVFHWKHLQYLTPSLNLGVDFNEVSDNNYYRDFGDWLESAEKVNLNRQIWLSYERELFKGDLFGFFTVQNFQTLQNIRNTIDEPYKLLPQLTLEWSRTVGNAEVSLFGQFSRFDHKTKQTGSRFVMYPRVLWNFANEWGYIRPKIGLHATQYILNDFTGIKDNEPFYYSSKNRSRVLPVFSLDAGFAAERFLNFKGKSLVQTLEPRFFYTYIPHSEQNDLPNFDSSEDDFLYSNLFRENRFTGHDRINAASTLSMSAMSRIYEKKSGLELVRFGLGQKYYFKEDNTYLNDYYSLREKNKSDFVFFASGRLTDTISINGDWYYNQSQSRYNRYSAALRYNPELGKTLNLRYKVDKNSPWKDKRTNKLEQVDFSFQWPVMKQYHLVGRYNYSITDKKTLEGVLGMEYLSDCGCWGAGVVVQHYVTDFNKRKNAVFVQLNLKGLGGLGVNPYRELRRSIPGFVPISEVKK